jgi:hypothetical protein
MRDICNLFIEGNHKLDGIISILSFVIILLVLRIRKNKANFSLLNQIV